MLETSLDRVWDPVHLPPRGSFDPTDELQLEAVATRLLELFWDHGDVEAFALMCALVRSRLLVLATSLVGRLGLDRAPEDLVEDVQRRLFLASRDPVATPGNFLGLARGLMLQEARRPSASPPTSPSEFFGSRDLPWKNGQHQD